MGTANLRDVGSTMGATCWGCLLRRIAVNGPESRRHWSDPIWSTRVLKVPHLGHQAFPSGCRVPSFGRNRRSWSSPQVRSCPAQVGTKSGEKCWVRQSELRIALSVEVLPPRSHDLPFIGPPWPASNVVFCAVTGTLQRSSDTIGAMQRRSECPVREDDTCFMCFFSEHALQNATNSNDGAPRHRCEPQKTAWPTRRKALSSATMLCGAMGRVGPTAKNSSSSMPCGVSRREASHHSVEMPAIGE